MPFTSRAQSRLFHAAAGSPKVAKKLGLKQSVAKKFITDSGHQKVGKLPEHVQKKAQGGAVCPKTTRW